MNSLLSCCGLVNARINGSEKDLSVCTRCPLALLKSRLLMWKRLWLQGKGSTVNLRLGVRDQASIIQK